MIITPSIELGSTHSTRTRALSFYQIMIHPCSNQHWLRSLGLVLILWHFIFYFQADPTDADTFPFVLLGNKVDIDGGHSRMVPTLTLTKSISRLFDLELKLKAPLLCRFRRIELENGVPPRETYLTLKPRRRRITISKKRFYVRRKIH